MTCLGFIPGMPGGIELVIFLLIILIFFGKRLPSAMFSVGKSITEFKKGVNENIEDDSEEDEDEEPRPKKKKTEQISE